MAEGTTGIARVPAGTDLVEWYFEQGWTDGLPVVPPTGERVAACIQALGGQPEFLECRVPPRHGGLTREVLAINMVMAGCKPDYAPVVRAAMLALTTQAFNLNGVQATTHMAGPLLIVNGPLARAIGMNGGVPELGRIDDGDATRTHDLQLLIRTDECSRVWIKPDADGMRVVGQGHQHTPEPVLVAKMLIDHQVVDQA